MINLSHFYSGNGYISKSSMGHSLHRHTVESEKMPKCIVHFRASKRNELRKCGKKFLERVRESENRKENKKKKILSANIIINSMYTTTDWNIKKNWTRSPRISLKMHNNQFQSDGVRLLFFFFMHFHSFIGFVFSQIAVSCSQEAEIWTKMLMFFSLSLSVHYVPFSVG